MEYSKYYENLSIFIINIMTYIIQYIYYDVIIQYHDVTYLIVVIFFGFSLFHP